MTLRWPGVIRREAVLAAALATSLASVLLWFGPPGADLAAHVYQRTVFLEHGFTLWNNFWYAGRYSFVTYSVLYYPLAGLVGIKILALASIATAALTFAVLLEREWGPAVRVEPFVRRGLGRDGAVGGVPVRARRGARAAGAAGAAAWPPRAVRDARGAHARGEPAGVRDPRAPARRDRRRRGTRRGRGSSYRRSSSSGPA